MRLPKPWNSWLMLVPLFSTENYMYPIERMLAFSDRSSSLAVIHVEKVNWRLVTKGNYFKRFN